MLSVLLLSNPPTITCHLETGLITILTSIPPFQSFLKHDQQSDLSFESWHRWVLTKCHPMERWSPLVHTKVIHLGSTCMDSTGNTSETMTKLCYPHSTRHWFHIFPFTSIDRHLPMPNIRQCPRSGRDQQCCWGSLLATKHFTKSCNEARTLVMATSHVVGYRATEHPRLFEESARGRFKACDFYDYNNLPVFLYYTFFYVVNPLITVPWRGSVSLSSDFPYPFDIGIFTSCFRISSSSFWVPQISIYLPVNGHRQSQGLEDEFPLKSLKTCDFQGPTVNFLKGSEG